ncbi:MAG: NADH-quinone oxidoreductase subunit J [Phototrophicales bacterium]|nr:MAG: NADH-quinone oxidoreductase subunit J [Phototrophicales bacterium]
MELTWQAIAFFIFSALTLGGGFAVVTQRNIFHAALFLMLSLFGTAGLFVLLIAPFLAAVQVLVYIGAIAILVLFAIMLTRRLMGLTISLNQQWPAAALAMLVLFGVLLLVLTPVGDDILGQNWSANLPTDGDTAPEVTYITVREIGVAFSTQNGFVLPFEIVSLLLTSALIGAIVVAREDEAI